MSYIFKYADLLDDEVFKLVFGRESTDGREGRGENGPPAQEVPGGWSC